MSQYKIMFNYVAIYIIRIISIVVYYEASKEFSYNDSYLSLSLSLLFCIPLFSIFPWASNNLSLVHIMEHDHHYRT